MASDRPGVVLGGYQASRGLSFRAWDRADRALAHAVCRRLRCPAHTPGQLAFADAAGFGLLNLSSGELTRIADPEGDLPGNRFNDGKVDRAGRFWAGSMDDRCENPSGSLYRLDPDHSVHRMASGFIFPNGMGWSPDDRLMYFTDSMLRTLWTYEFDLRTGALGERREFAHLSDDDGVFDGLTVDSEGYVWVAVWNGWRVIRYAPDGSIDREVRFPVQRPSSCMFGGHDLRTLYVTSACVELGWKDLRTGPLAGALTAGMRCAAGRAETVYGADEYDDGQRRRSRRRVSAFCEYCCRDGRCAVDTMSGDLWDGRGTAPAFRAEPFAAGLGGRQCAHWLCVRRGAGG